jgi:hypothetical protein
VCALTPRAQVVLTNDHGPCANRKEPLAKGPDIAFRWHSEEMRKASLLMNEGSIHNGTKPHTHTFNHEQTSRVALLTILPTQL